VASHRDRRLAHRDGGLIAARARDQLVRQRELLQVRNAKASRPYSGPVRINTLDAAADRLQLGLDAAPVPQEDAFRSLTTLHVPQEMRTLRRCQRSVGDTLPAIDGS